jgi:hypothetical protein
MRAAGRRVLAALALAIVGVAGRSDAQTDSLGTAPADSLVTPPDPVLARPLRVCGSGDLMLGSDLDTTWVTAAARRVGRAVPALPSAPAMVAPLVPLLADADIVLVNVEGAIGEGPVPRKCRPGSRFCYAFRQPPDRAAAIAGLSARGVVVGNVANNHAMDAGAAGFAETRQMLETAGVGVTGADTIATAVGIGSDTIGVLGFATAQAGPDPRDLAAVRRHVRRAADRFGRVVVTMHMGAEGASAQRTGDSTEMYLGENRGNVVAFARAAAESGAAFVIGHGPHVLRAAEWWQGSLLVYSLGNLLTYGPFNMNPPRHHGGFACAVIAPDASVSDGEIRSTLQRRPGIVSVDPAHGAGGVVDSLSRLDFGETGVRIEAGQILDPEGDGR